jgi:hypothetical protein
MRSGVVCRWIPQRRIRTTKLGAWQGWALIELSLCDSAPWGGREFFTESPNDLEGLTLRTYNGATHLWSLYWANSRDGILSSAQVGKFDHGQGEFYSQDNSDGKSKHPAALRLVQDHTGFRAFRAGVFGGWWQKLGGKLDLRHDAHRRCRGRDLLGRGNCR